MRAYVRKTTTRDRLSPRCVARVTSALLDAVGESEATVSISLVGDAAIRRMNRDYRGKDCATDVLSFPQFAAQIGDSGGGPERLLGDIVISLDTARRQAEEYDASLDDEVRRLLIHGILHLLGHDHERPRERARMRAEERRLASAIGLRWPY